MSARDAFICRRAAEVIRARGLHKYGFEGDDGSVCIWGALRIAHGGNAGYSYDRGDLPEIADAIVDRVACDGEDDQEFPGAGFNDDDDTTAEDVEKLLLQIADEVELL